MKGIICLIFLLYGFLLNSQNKELLYDFVDVPQALLLNPGANTNFKFHAGLPLLSQFHINGGLRGASLHDVFADDGRNINEKIEITLAQLSSKDYLTFTQQLEILTIGWRNKRNENIYYSAGIYQELDFIGYFPKDFAVLAYQGNQDFINQPFKLSNISGSGELLMTYHFGYSKKVSKNFTFGARAKLYSSMLHLRSARNSGTFTTVETPQGNNVYQHIISNADVIVRSSGISSLREIEAESTSAEIKEGINKLLGRALLGGNLGIGLDAGFTHMINDQLSITGSFNDLGLVYYTKDIETYSARGNYVFEGFETPIQFSGQDPENFLEELEEAVPLDTLRTNYLTMRPLKLNGSIKYSFNKYDDGTCYYCIAGESPPYQDAFGLQLFTQFRPKRPQYAASVFYYKRWFNFLRTKIAYTIDEYSLYNVGFLISSHIQKINFYISTNNILEYANLAKARGVSMQFGFNFIL
ncbi:hypothetical protein J8281_02070 [Aquimarina sp. U1-2]|uniref:DUF5723 family protein n=1 Tax=Aquimarina sp. U1-2 TaxID=2823141 RepID=UPI001AEC8572|nr:DUF5723 family protein [Aquimarina sp. U1-2]MBP2830960.1 hypothetical protein [Aquimarina sp. U1-2]